MLKLQRILCFQHVAHHPLLCFQRFAACARCRRIVIVEQCHNGRVVVGNACNGDEEVIAFACKEVGGASCAHERETFFAKFLLQFVRNEPLVAVFPKPKANVFEE